MKKYYDKKNLRLIFIKENATPEYWDRQWKTENLKKVIESGATERFVSNITKKFIIPDRNNKILEGGCGNGMFVFSLAHRGYDSYGVDFAGETIRKIKAIRPELKVIEADVRKLPFSDNYFDGYWSLGVIEHFYNGYDEIADEMARVIKPGGYLFLTFPYVSLLRKFKSMFNFYPSLESNNEPVDFYQFALPWNEVMRNFKDKGFELIKKKPFEGFKGCKDESFTVIKNIMQKIYDCPDFSCKLFGYILSIILAPICGHAILLILKKK